jgi:hypothetical protein
MQFSRCLLANCGCGCPHAVFAMSSRELWLRMSSCSFPGVAADVLMQISRVWLRMSSCRFRGCGCGCACAVFAMSSREELWLRMSSCSFRGVFYKIIAADLPLQFSRCLLANSEVLLGIVVGDVPMQFSRCLVVYQFMAADDCACEM